MLCIITLVANMIDRSNFKIRQLINTLININNKNVYYYIVGNLSYCSHRY